MDEMPTNAGSIARQRLENYLADKLKNEEDDLTTWEFYTYLLEQAKKHNLDRSGYESLEYQQDKKETTNNCRKMEEERHNSGFRLPEHKRKSRSLR